MSKVYLYKNKLWKVFHDFVYTGEGQEFSLTPGKYLMVCKGARGGQGYNPSLRIEDVCNYGGTTYGILDLKESSTMYAVVGGIGGDCSNSVSTSVGGFNGGGNGGVPYSSGSSYKFGAGGGGASDIRLKMTDDYETQLVQIPNGYNELEYIESGESQYINTGYIHKSSTKIECVCEVTETNINYNCLFGSRKDTYNNNLSLYTKYANNKYTALGVSNTEYMYSSVRMPYGQKVKFVIYGNTLTCYDMENTVLFTYSYQAGFQTDGFCPMYIFNMDTNNAVSAYYCKAKIYSFNIYENDMLVKCYIPAELNNGTDPITNGLYDLIDDEFLISENNVNFTSGEIKETKTTINKILNVTHSSLLSRIIVAGGGGGGYNNAVEVDQQAGFGGGACGGYPLTNITDPNYMLYPTQSSGYSFGYGMTAGKRTSNASNGTNGASGGGGGWFGGYTSSLTNATSSSCNGGGGSSYALTSTSYKPTDYFINTNKNISDFYFTDVLMTIGDAEEPEIFVCKEIKTPSVGDVIICPSIGEMQQFNLNKGRYTIRCWGASGGTRSRYNYGSKGGYACGTFENPMMQRVYVYVGGSATYAGTCRQISVEFAESMAWLAGFNGGGQQTSTSDYRNYCCIGGGASDIRIGTDSLLSRIIVAGGGGGMGYGSSRAGNGGGETGSNPTTTGNGTNYGAGTQTASPTGTYTTVVGGFGYGGNSSTVNNGYGGAGGGGWFGGSGTYPDSSNDNDKAGAGGSGYVLTASSYKPAGYLLDERYYMTDTVLTQAGNTLPKGISKIEIEVLQIDSSSILCHDAQGFKYYDTSLSSWEYLKTEMIDETDFENYGVGVFENDAGLLRNFDIYVYSPSSEVDTINFNVIPCRQLITSSRNVDNYISKISIDADVDESNVDFEASLTRHGSIGNLSIDLTMSVDIHNIPSFVTQIYAIQCNSTGCVLSHHEPKPKTEIVTGYYDTLNTKLFYSDMSFRHPIRGEMNKLYKDLSTNIVYYYETNKFIQHRIDLLPIGIGNKLPTNYKTYIGGFLDNEQTEAITTINSVAMCERNREIFTVTMCNDKTLRICKLNMVLNKVTIIKDISKTLLDNTYYGGMLVDDNYVYIASCNNSNKRAIFRIPLNPNDTTVNQYTAPDTIYFINAFGKMQWYNDHKIIVCVRYGFALFDTESLTWELKNQSTSAEKYDFAYGNDIAIATLKGNSNTITIYNFKTNTWGTTSTLNSETFDGSYQNCCCYGDGKFYVTQQGHIYILNGDDCKIEKRIVSAYSALTPKTINYANGILYITIKESMTLYIYDIENDRFSSTSLPFSTNGWETNKWSRPTTFRGYFFMGDIKLYIANFVDYSKYNMGYKYDKIIFLMNNEHANEYQYDERFITFGESGMSIHEGIITSELEPVEDVENVSYASFDKSQYNKLLSVNIFKNST